MIPLDHGELVHREPVVIGRIIEVNEIYADISRRAVLPAAFDRYSFDEEPVEVVVVCEQEGELGPFQPGYDSIGGSDVDVRIDPEKGISQPAFENNLVILFPIRTGPAVGIGRYVGAV